MTREKIPNSGLEESGEYTIRSPKQLRALAAPMRMRVVEVLSSAEMHSISELADIIGVTPHSLYHHVKILNDVGLVREAGARKTGRRTEKLYRLIAPRLQADLTKETPAFRSALAKAGITALRAMQRSYEDVMEGRNAILDGEARNAAVRYLALRLSPEKLAALNADLDALIMNYAVQTQDPSDDNLHLKLLIALAPGK